MPYNGVIPHIFGTTLSAHVLHRQDQRDLGRLTGRMTDRDPGTTRRSLRRAAALVPGRDDRHAALRVGLGVAVPLLALLALGHPGLSIYAVFGALTGMYGRGETAGARLRHQSAAAALLLAGLALGVLLSALHAPWQVLVPVEAAFGGVASLAADRAALQPEGPFYALFALGACAMVPLAVPPGTAVAVSAGSAALSLLLGQLGRPLRQPPKSNSPAQAVRSVHALRYLTAVAVAGATAALTGPAHVHWTMAAAAVPLGAPDKERRIRRGVHRVLGTGAGLAIAAAILASHPDPTTLSFAVMAMLFPTELFMRRHYALAMTFFTPAILLMTQLAAPTSPRAVILDRGIDTIIGASIGIAAALAIPDPPVRPAGQPRAV